MQIEQLFEREIAQVLIRAVNDSAQAGPVRFGLIGNGPDSGGHGGQVGGVHALTIALG